MNEHGTPTTAGAVERTRWGPVVALAMAMLVVSVEMSLAAVTLPVIGAEMGVGPAATAWVLLAYVLPTAALAVPAGRWVDRADLRSVLMVAVTGVGLTSLLAAFAPAFWTLLVARVLQGIAGGLVVAIYMPVVRTSVRAEHRGRALGYIATIMPLGTMAGASLGGLVAGAYGWRPVFLLKIPILLVVLWLGYRTVPGGRGGLPAPDRSLLGEVAILGGAVAALLLAFDRVGGGAVVVVPLAVTALALAVAWSRLPASRPVITLVRRRAYGLPLAALLLMSSVVGLTLFLLPYLVADVLRGTPGTTGVALLFFVGGMAVCSPVSGALADRYRPNVIAVAGGAVTLAGTLSMLTLGPSAGLVDLAWRLALVGAGQGLFNAPNNVALLAAAPSGMTGTAGGVGATVRTLGFTVGPAVTSLAWHLAGGGAGGFRAGVIVLASAQVAGLAVLAAVRAGRRDGEETTTN
ncbi:MFS transporter [Streptosporangium longisporum]|uniref:MFS transporter n=1 Tax=Streptosporangium longisporum TaxID=46187 RepID=A0ABN3XT39_9ACTN